MMSSIFSSFEAMGAESYGWKLVNSSPQKISTSSVVDNKNSNSSATVSSSPLKKDGSEDVSQQKKKKLINLKRNPHFAVEFDGVHCFETIVPY